MSSMYIYDGGVSIVLSASSVYVFSPFVFLILDMCGSFLAFAAAPKTKVNFASSSWAIILRACSLVCISMFVFVCGSACFCS